jgi:membrane protein
MLGLALALLPLIATLVALLLSTPRAVTAVGDSLGIGEPWLSMWTLGRWPILVLLFGVLVAALYYLTPNLRHERVRWVTLGAAFTVVVWMTATGLFALYVATVGQYDRVYGWLGGGLVLLLWLWISNLVLVLGAEVDAELVRARQLGAGMAAEEAILLPARDTSRTLLLARHRADDLSRARALRDLPRDPPGGPR